MSTILNKVKIIAHRGLPSCAFENTISSFEEAAKRPTIDGIETDVYITADKGFVCVHDDAPFVETSKNVFEMTVKEAQGYTLKPSKNFPYIHGGKYHLPTFEQYLEICIKHDKLAVIELKNPVWTDESLGRLLDIIKKNNYTKKTIFISFNDKAVEGMLKIAPKETIVQQLIYNGSQYSLMGYLERGFSIDFGDELSPTVTNGVKISADDIKFAHSKNLTVNVWSVDTIKRAEELAELGVDHITTNFDLRGGATA
jgi:glycerophosphoryl diester phosphodiesterase